MKYFLYALYFVLYLCVTCLWLFVWRDYNNPAFIISKTFMDFASGVIFYAMHNKKLAGLIVWISIYFVLYAIINVIIYHVVNV